MSEEYRSIGGIVYQVDPAELQNEKESIPREMYVIVYVAAALGVLAAFVTAWAIGLI